MNRRGPTVLARSVLVGLTFTLAACAPLAPVETVTPTAPSTSTAPSTPSAPSAPSAPSGPSAPSAWASITPTSSPPAAPESPIRYEDALAESTVLAAEFHDGANYNDDKWQALRQKRHLDEHHVRRLLDAITAACVAAWANDDPACAALGDTDKDIGKATEALITMLGRLAEPATAVTPSIRTLVRLDELGVWRASLAIGDVLERRAHDHAVACQPPTAAEVESARQSLADFAIVDEGRGPKGGNAATAPFARWPTPAELDDLAYFYAATAEAGPEVGVDAEDLATPELKAGHPDLVARTALRAELKAAMRDADLARHLRVTEAYLATLGYPGPMRLRQEGDQRWGGAGASYLMRAAATHAELLGRFDVAETYYRRATPGGGSCGTSTASRRASQIEGVIRVTELAHGCHRAVAEHLYAPQMSEDSPYGPTPLAKAGYDVARLYAGALLTMGRDDATELDRLFVALSKRSADALSRRQRMGTEAWATRVRAIGGFAEAAKGASVPRLLALAEAGNTNDRVEALRILGSLAEDRGYDPCRPARFHYHWGHSSSGIREVHTVMDECGTRIAPTVIEGAARRIEALSGDPEPKVREGVAHTLGQLGLQRSRAVLTRLVKDSFDAGGTVCTMSSNAPEVCEPNRPVSLAAKEALKRLKEVVANRAEQRAGK